MPSLATHVADGRSAAEGAMTSAEVGERVRSAALVAGDRRELALSLVASARPGDEEDSPDAGSMAPRDLSRAALGAWRSSHAIQRLHGPREIEPVAGGTPGRPASADGTRHPAAPDGAGAQADRGAAHGPAATATTHRGPSRGSVARARRRVPSSSAKGRRPPREGLAAAQRRANQEAARRSATGAMLANEPQVVGTVPGRHFATGAVARTASGAARRGAWAAAAALAGVPAALAIAALLGVALVVAPVASLSSPAVDPAWLAGLPPYVTSEMLVEAVRCQEEFGHPAGCTIAQVILESGDGDGLSGLAENCHNLFGIKWVPDEDGAEGVTGHRDYSTGEEAADGTAYTTVASFACFESDAACIRFRSAWFLQLANYRDNPTIRRAIEGRDSGLMADGLADAGWATSHSYAEALRSIIATYDLARLDRATVASLASPSAVSGTLSDGALSARQAAVVSACSWVPSPGSGLCAAWVSDVFEAAGMGYPGGDARDYYWWWCVTSDLSELRPGMVVAVPTYPSEGLGAIYGHVAIYVGGGMVMENVGAIQATPIDTWIDWYSGTVTPRWGWVYGTDLSR